MQGTRRAPKHWTKAFSIFGCGNTTGFGAAERSSWYFAAGRRDMQFAKELARRVSAPRQCNWNAARVLGSHLNRHPKIAKVIALDAEITTRDDWMSLQTVDWAGCLETRRSTNCFVAVLGGAVVQIGTQTQPELPATSSSDAEIRGASRGAREAIFLSYLGKLDFGLKIARPKLWTDSSAAMQTSKRILAPS